MSPNLQFQIILQLDLRWALTLICDLLTAWTYKGFHIIWINQVWFKSDFNFSNEAICTFSAYLTTWPQMTFDLGICPLTTWSYEESHGPSHIISININKVWVQSDFNFSNEATFSLFSAYLTTWPHMTFDFDMWPLISSTNVGSHVASMQTHIWLKSIKACGRYSQMLTCFHNRQQQQGTKRFLSC